MRTLSVIRKDFIQFLKLVFTDGKIKANGQTIFLYDEDDKKTGILIKGTSITNPEVLLSKPAIMVSRGDVMPEENTKTLGHNVLSHNWETGVREHGYVMSGPVNLNCLSPRDEEAESLAQIVYTVIEQHKPYLSKTYKYRKINLGVIGKPRILRYEGEGTTVEIWNCPVIAQVSFHFGYRYTQVLNGVGEIDFPFLKPPIAVIEGIAQNEVEE